MLYGLLVLGTLLNVLGDVAARYWHAGRCAWWLCVPLYAADLACWMGALTYGATLGRTAVIWKSLGFVCLLIAGKLLFAEDMTLLTKIGVAITFIGMSLAEAGAVNV